MPSAWSVPRRCTRKVACGTPPGASPRMGFCLRTICAPPIQLEATPTDTRMRAATFTFLINLILQDRTCPLDLLCVTAKFATVTSVGRASYRGRRPLPLQTGTESCPPRETDSFPHWQASHSHTASRHFHESPTQAHSTHREVSPTHRPDRESQPHFAKALYQNDRSSLPNQAVLPHACHPVRLALLRRSSRNRRSPPKNPKPKC